MFASEEAGQLCRLLGGGRYVQALILHKIIELTVLLCHRGVRRGLP